MFTEAEELHWKRIRLYHRVIGSRLLPETHPLNASVFTCSARIPFGPHQEGTYRPLATKEPWGKGNDRAWFKITGSVPPDWQGEPIVLWLDTGTEALVYREDGTVLHGLTSGALYDNVAWKMSRPFVDVTAHVSAGESFTFWAEAGCLSHPWEENHNQPIAPEPSVGGFPNGILHQCCLGRFDPSVWGLYMDMEVLIGLCDGLPADSLRRADVFRVLRDACDQFGRDENDFEAVRALLQPALAAPAEPSAVTVRATGHAHLDTAWLWTLDVTRQKAARTFSNQLDLLDRYPEYVFGSSTGLHYQWIKDDFPELYERICKYIAEGRWEIQGGMWVEADTNMPSGESLIRQFLYGKNFFKEEFGKEIDLLWLPDVFGYSAALPQIMSICGVRSLLTQKISWSQFNVFPHHTFLWEGIDGTETLVHFPPENNYCSSLETKPLIDAQNRFAERDRLDSMLSLFGYGDGGGGATPFHLERALRLKDLEGAPKVEMGRADELFDYFHQNREKLNRWVGELYLELHRKTLTTQAFIKKANRRLEEKLTALEMLWSAIPQKYPNELLGVLWKTLLLNQFHDIIPGSSIKEVYDEARKQFDAAFSDCENLCEEWAELHLKPAEGQLVLFNPLSVAYKDLIEVPADFSSESHPVQSFNERSFVAVNISPLSFLELKKSEATAEKINSSETLVLENDRVAFTFNSAGRLTAMIDKQTGRHLMNAGEEGNCLCLYNDRPAQWEAWDVDLYYENERIETAECVGCSAVETGPLFSALRLNFRIGLSDISQTVRLRNGSCRLDFETEVDWRESRRLLRVGFPTAIQSPEAAYDIQFGYLKRSAHRNTSREKAMFEVCGHRYADLSQADCGVALLNDCKYGYKVHDGELSLSLLAAPCMPDPQADRGHHSFTYSILPHLGNLIESPVRREAAQLNRSPLMWSGKSLPPTLKLPVRLESRDLTLEALKKAENGGGLIVRVSETAGKKSSGTLLFAAEADVLESDAIEWTEGGFRPAGSSLEISLKPFEIKTWRVRFG